MRSNKIVGLGVACEPSNFLFSFSCTWAPFLHALHHSDLNARLHSRNCRVSYALRWFAAQSPWVWVQEICLRATIATPPMDLGHSLHLASPPCWYRDQALTAIDSPWSCQRYSRVHCEKCACISARVSQSGDGRESGLPPSVVGPVAGLCILIECVPLFI